MLVVDDSKLKLLKMNEKLLEVYADKRGVNQKLTKQAQEYLSKFETMAKEIDKEVTDAYRDEVKTANYRNLEYPQQLEKLLELSQEYDDVYGLQCGFENIYEKYADGKLKLSKLSDILIDDIRTRISNIQGYLINSRQLEKNKNDLVKLSEDLADCEKKRENHQNRFSTMETDLKYDFINAEGRKLVGDKQEYTSVIKEYSDNDIDLRKILDDSELLNGMIDQYEEVRRATEEKLDAAKICYEKMPDYQEEYQSIMNDMLLARYRLTLLQIAKLISSEKTDYTEMIRKRKELKALNSVREESLKGLNTTFLIDPFRRNLIDEQIDIINGYDNQTKEVMTLRKRIANLTTVIENRESTNTDFIIALNAENNFIKEESPLRKIMDDVNKNRIIANNMVMSLRNPNNGFKSSLVKEKTQSVIKRVSSIFKNQEVSPVKEEEVSDIEVTVPTLVIEEKEQVSDKEIPKDDNTQDNKYILDNPLKETNIFPDELTKLKDESDKKDNLVTEHEIIHIDNAFTNTDEEKNNQVGVDAGHEIIHMLPESKNEEKDSKINGDLFTEVEPFEEVSLFSDKYEGEPIETSKVTKPVPMENVLVNKPEKPETTFVQSQKNISNSNLSESKTEVSTNQETPAMPEAFWVTREDKIEEKNDNEPTFDEQIDNLINNGGRSK